MLLISAIIWGFGVTIQSISGQTLESFTVVFFKALGATLLIPIAIILKQKFSKDAFVGGIICGLIMFVANYAQQKGIETSSVGKASFITALYMVFVPIIGILFFKRKTKVIVWIGVAIATIGMYLLCVKETLALSSGDVWLIICAIAFALQILIADKYVATTDPIPLACVQSLTMCIMAGICMFIFEKPEIATIKSAWFTLLYSALLSCCFAQTAQIVFQKYVEPTLASLIMSLESVFGIFSGFLILNQTLSIKELIGCALIFIAVLIAQKK